MASKYLVKITYEPEGEDPINWKIKKVRPFDTIVAARKERDEIWDEIYISPYKSTAWSVDIYQVMKKEK